MPNWSDLYKTATTPLVPKQAIQGMQDALEEPHLDQSPLMAGIKGFGSGALEGLRGLTSPTNLAGIAMLAGGGGLGGAFKGVQAASKLAPAAQGVSDLTNIVPDLVEAAPAVKQVMPTIQDAMDLGGLLKHNLAKIPSAARLNTLTGEPMTAVGKAIAGPMEGLQGALSGAAPTAEMVAPGLEDAYNASRTVAQAAKPKMWSLPRPGDITKTPILGQ